MNADCAELTRLYATPALELTAVRESATAAVADAEARASASAEAAAAAGVEAAALVAAASVREAMAVTARDTANAEIATLNSKLGTLITTHAEEFARMDKEWEDATAAYAAEKTMLTASLAAANTSIAAMTSEAALAGARLAEATSRATRAETALKGARAEADLLALRMRNAESVRDAGVANYATQLSRLTTSESSLKAELERKTVELITMQADVAGAREAASAHQDQLALASMLAGRYREEAEHARSLAAATSGELLAEREKQAALEARCKAAVEAAEKVAADAKAELAASLVRTDAFADGCAKSELAARNAALVAAGDAAEARAAALAKAKEAEEEAASARAFAASAVALQAEVDAAKLAIDFHRSEVGVLQARCNTMVGEVVAADARAEKARLDGWAALEAREAELNARSAAALATAQEAAAALVARVTSAAEAAAVEAAERSAAAVAAASASADAALTASRAETEAALKEAAAARLDCSALTESSTARAAAAAAGECTVGKIALRIHPSPVLTHPPPTPTSLRGRARLPPRPTRGCHRGRRRNDIHHTRRLLLRARSAAECRCRCQRPR